MPPEGASHHYFDPPDERFHVRSRKEDLTEDAQARSTTIYPPTPITKYELRIFDSKSKALRSKLSPVKLKLYGS